MKLYESKQHPRLYRQARDTASASRLFSRETGKALVEFREVGHGWAKAWERWIVDGDEVRREPS